MKVGVVVPVLNQFQLSIEALWSVSTKFDWQPYIQANWRNNRGVAGAWNDGIDQAFNNNCNYVLVINDDVILSPWTIDNQIKILEDGGDSLVSFTSAWNAGIPSGNPFDMMSYPEPESNAWVAGLDFACFMITKHCYQTVGKFDEKFFPAYFEDNDYHRRIILSGLNARMVTTAPFFHYGSRTQTTGSVVSHDQFDINKAYYKRKWGGVPGAEIFATPFNIPGAPVSYME